MTEQESKESNIIKTQDENGEIHSFELIDIINVDGQDYGLLLYVEEESSKAQKEDDEEEELVIMKLNQENDQYTFEMIEDDSEFNKVIEALEEEAEAEEEEGE
jgi:hypothetical protein